METFIKHGMRTPSITLTETRMKCMNKRVPNNTLMNLWPSLSGGLVWRTFIRMVISAMLDLFETSVRFTCVQRIF